ncbi:MAG TPA: diacylglycerol kinase family protein [Polyangiaceae bacterium]
MNSDLVTLQPTGTASEQACQRVLNQQGSTRAGSALHSFVYAGRGLVELVRTERNARIHVGFAVLVVALGLWLGIPAREFGVLCATITLVVAAEALNTAVEAIVDLVSPDYHPLARRAKDIAAGAVLWCALGAVVTGCCLLAPPLVARMAW